MTKTIDFELAEFYYEEEEDSWLELEEYYNGKNRISETYREQ